MFNQTKNIIFWFLLILFLKFECHLCLVQQCQGKFCKVFEPIDSSLLALYEFKIHTNQSQLQLISGLMLRLDCQATK
jgi:hypothetical protein